MGFGYLSAAIIALIVLLAFRKYTKDRALWRRVKKNLPRTGAAGRLIVLSAGNRRLPAGTELPFEQKDGRVVFTVPEFTCHQMVELAY